LFVVLPAVRRPLELAPDDEYPIGMQPGLEIKSVFRTSGIDMQAPF